MEKRKKKELSFSLILSRLAMLINRMKRNEIFRALLFYAPFIVVAFAVYRSARENLYNNKKPSIKRRARIVMIHRICFHISCLMQFLWIYISFLLLLWIQFLPNIDHKKGFSICSFSQLASEPFPSFSAPLEEHSSRTLQPHFYYCTRSNNIIKVLRNQQTFRSRSFVLVPNPAPVFARFVGRRNINNRKITFPLWIINALFTRAGGRKI